MRQVQHTVLLRRVRPLHVTQHSSTRDQVNRAGHRTSGVRRCSLTARQLRLVGIHLTGLTMGGVRRLNTGGMPITDECAGFDINVRLGLVEAEKHLAVFQDLDVKRLCSLLRHGKFPFLGSKEKLDSHPSQHTGSSKNQGYSPLRRVAKNRDSPTEIVIVDTNPVGVYDGPAP